MQDNANSVWSSVQLTLSRLTFKHNNDKMPWSCITLFKITQLNNHSIVRFDKRKRSSGFKSVNLTNPDQTVVIVTVSKMLEWAVCHRVQNFKRNNWNSSDLSVNKVPRALLSMKLWKCRGSRMQNKRWFCADNKAPTFRVRQLHGTIKERTKLKKNSITGCHVLVVQRQSCFLK